MRLVVLGQPGRIVFREFDDASYVGFRMTNPKNPEPVIQMIPGMLNQRARPSIVDRAAHHQQVIAKVKMALKRLGRRVMPSLVGKKVFSE
ncbi:MAG TPA: hypothetical protein VER03_17950, partial [Bryobacteraceae bacterium]|nr:hypothetical protein [Bryobacteraceae bacterium]